MFIIHPYYTGRDKGPLVEFISPPPATGPNCFVPTFPDEESAKQYLRDRGKSEREIEQNYRIEQR